MPELNLSALDMSAIDPDINHGDIIRRPAGIAARAEGE